MTWRLDRLWRVGGFAARWWPRLGGWKKRPTPAPPRLAKFKSPRPPLGMLLANKSLSLLSGAPLVPRAPCTAAHRPRLHSLCPTGQGPRHAQPSAARQPAARSPGGRRRDLGAPAPPRGSRQAPRSRAPRVFLLRRGHPGQACPPRAPRRRPNVRRRRGPRLGSLPVSRDVAAGLPERESLPAVPPAAPDGAPRGSPLRPPGPRRHRYELLGRPGTGRAAEAWQPRQRAQDRDVPEF